MTKVNFDADSQLKFVLTCIKYSVMGKVDFGAVATELNLVSRGAAAKRYERLLKSYEIATGPARPPTPENTLPQMGTFAPPPSRAANGAKNMKSNKGVQGKGSIAKKHAPTAMNQMVGANPSRRLHNEADETETDEDMQDLIQAADGVKVRANQATTNTESNVKSESKVKPEYDADKVLKAKRTSANRITKTKTKSNIAELDSDDGYDDDDATETPSFTNHGFAEV